MAAVICLTKNPQDQYQYIPGKTIRKKESSISINNIPFKLTYLFFSDGWARYNRLKKCLDTPLTTIYIFSWITSVSCNRQSTSVDVAAKLFLEPVIQAKRAATLILAKPPNPQTEFCWIYYIFSTFQQTSFRELCFFFSIYKLIVTMNQISERIILVDIYIYYIYIYIYIYIYMVK